MVTVHHLNNSRSQRILWLLEELNVPYEVIRYERDARTNLAPESLKKLHPLGKSPMISDDGKVIAESGCIVEYLVEKYGQKKLMLVAEHDAYWSYKYWLHYAEGSLMPLLVMKLIFDKIKTAKQPFFVKPISKIISDKVMESYVGPNLENNLEFIEKHLAENLWFAGDQMTAADVQMVFPLEAAMSRIENQTKYPSIREYVKKIHDRSAYQLALEKGGEYAYAQVA
ncbi:glutathione S-transferase [Aliikangiella marina]|uniref:glutathione transferase n=1 Tax=Aliikangiella marina TaxID=1712262 RepID=A0A545T6M1_9GAMM|nr:glutathione S-transferase [Aliikangiella marina]TQV72835.1 glutathione S-transferase [Aliikangiella marina]